MLVVVLLLVVVGGVIVSSHAVAVEPVSTVISRDAENIILPWPGYGQAAIGAVGYGVLATNGEQTVTPTASIAKLMTALVVLQIYPLGLGEYGPLLTLTDDDVRIYDEYVARDGSVIPVYEGMQITEYEALQALLLPSANNIADALAIWATGSLNEYNDYANRLARSLNMKDSVFTSASGYDENTVSTARDLVLLGTAAMQNPVIAEIVGQVSADLPNAGTVTNVNSLLGREGIVGIKTGNTEEAGGCYLFAANYEVVPGKTITIVGAIMGAPSRAAAMKDAVTLLAASKQGFREETLVTKGDIVARYAPDWADEVTATAQDNLRVILWRGTSASADVDVQTVKNTITAGDTVGTISFGTAQIPVVLSQNIVQPSRIWQLNHFVSSIGR